jgi:hypothetical protein
MSNRLVARGAETLAAIGELVLQTTWLEYLAARLVTIAGLTDNEMALLAPHAHVFQQARKAANRMNDTDVKRRTLEWLKQAKTTKPNATQSRTRS